MEAGGDVARSLLNVGHMPWHKWAIDRNNRVMEDQFLPDVERSLGLGNSASKKTTLLNQALKHIEEESGQKLASVSTLDKESYRSLMSNLKVLMLAGFETTSAILCWIFKELQDNPDCMGKVRAEHDSVLGPDPENASEILRESPQLLNSLPYTQAVVRETLRMYPLTFAIREGTPGELCIVFPAVSWVSVWASNTNGGILLQRLLPQRARLPNPVPNRRVCHLGCHRLDAAEPGPVAASKRVRP